MHLLILFATGVLIGSAYCDNECFSSVFIDCARSTLNLGNDEDKPTLCNHLKKQFDCLKGKAASCGMSFTKEAENVSEILKQMCTKGNAINTEFERQKKCFKAAMDEKKCNEPIDKIMETAETIDEIISSNKEACRQINTYSKCIVESVERRCGGPNQKFFSSLFDPMMKFGKAVCEQLVAPVDEKMDEYKNVGLLSPYAIIPSFFIYA
ncbi:uncharacterized protein LOC129969695 [Argiope bruennichi]|uniref:Uncharacterized protein n=1 Tax=Argiope bruennichi TaxID=94029 RepID=A0A8T0FMS8_ARGBR|nr:uncharacterized protein LOC129969695 [Argiope bruennichi]KAF8792361.1 hypothetical protein HNY73_003965 [Argiope bruennichi]